MFYYFSNPFFLYYAWLELKRYQSIFISSRIYTSLPFKKSWFSKVSYLLRSNTYNYRSLTSNNFNSIFLINKDKVIENAIFNVVYPFFQNYYYFKIFSLSKHFCFNFSNVYIL